VTKPVDIHSFEVKFQNLMVTWGILATNEWVMCCCSSFGPCCLHWPHHSINVIYECLSPLPILLSVFWEWNRGFSRPAHALELSQLEPESDC